MRYVTPQKNNQFVDLFDEFFGFDPFQGRQDSRRALQVPIEVKEEKDFVNVAVEVPGIDRKDITLDYQDGILTVSGKKEEKIEDKKEGYYYSEFKSGSFSRSVRVGDVDISKGNAKLEEGILRIQLPKAEEKRTQQLKIQ